MDIQQLRDELELSAANDVLIEIDGRWLEIAEICDTSQGVILVAERDDRSMR